MKKIKYLYPILLVFMMSCEDRRVIPFSKMLTTITYAYSMSPTTAEVSIVTSQNPIFLDEVGVVWSVKSNTTTDGNRLSSKSVNNLRGYTYKLENLTPNTTYYLRAYYINQGVIFYDSDEVALTQNYDNTWTHLPSPTIDIGSYILASEGTSFGDNGENTFYAVDKTTNLFKRNYFSPRSDKWVIPYSDPRLFRDIPEPMRFEPFTADFLLNSDNITLIGGGYNKEFNGNRFFRKDFKIVGFTNFGSPSYPGANVSTSTFGIGTSPYVLENTSKGKLWRFNMVRSEWNETGTVPVAKEAKFISFSIGDRAFILPESNDWNDNLDGFYEYLPKTNQWKPMAAFKGENRRRGLSFVYNGKLYYGAGQSTKTLKGLRDIWEYNPTTNTWKPFVNYPGLGTLNLVTLVINNSLYIGFGQQVDPSENKGEGFSHVTDFWKFTIQ